MAMDPAGRVWTVGPVDGQVAVAVGTDPRLAAWEQARDAWLEEKGRRTGSQHTVRCYRRDHTEFFAWFTRWPWAVNAADADAWLRHLTAKPSKPATVNRKMSALASFFDYVAEKFVYLDDTGKEQRIYVDSTGTPRRNPFHQPQRFKIEMFGHSRPIGVETVRRCLRRIDVTTRLGARDYALLVTYLYTGRRSTEVAQLKWGDITADLDGGYYKYAWRGKGGTARQDELPPPAYHAIVHFLKVAGRWEGIRAGEYIFRSVLAVQRALYLPNVKKVDPNAPISMWMISRIVKRRFGAVDGELRMLVHTHTLRHTAAHLRYRGGRGQDILEISRLLGHSSVAVTQVYLSREQKPIDAGWTDVEELLAEPAPEAKQPVARLRRLHPRK